MRNFKLPTRAQINTIFHSFSKTERAIFGGFFLVLFVSTIAILQSISGHFLVQIPLRGGSLSVGIVGVPRFINPILANSQADLDMVALIYSGLMRKSSNGELILDLAEKYEKSENNLIYTFNLKDNLYFQDGKPVTADDILFTIEGIKNEVIENQHKMNWNGVNIEKIDEKTVKFTLRQPYASFLESTTLSILPKHLWENAPLELNNINTNPIGSGPYMVSEISKKSSGIIDHYRLIPFEKFALGTAYIKNINLHFYQNEDELVEALESGEVEEISSISPLNAKNLKEENYRVESSSLPRIFGLFFNQNQNQIFVNKTVIAAINQAINKEKIVEEVLFGYGTVIDIPIPPSWAEYQKPATQTNTSRKDLVQKAKNSLAEDGWKAGADGFLEKTTKEKGRNSTTKLEFSISTSNAPELMKTAEILKKDLAEIGIKVEIKTFETGNLNQDVIRPRKYEALLFGEIINHESDLFAFWHSSQRKDPGLNIAMYTNAKTDKILEEALVTVDKQSRIKKYAQFVEEIKKDIGAIFLYSPNLIYVVPENLKDGKMEQIILPADRYLNIYLWYNEVERIWKIFDTTKQK